MHTIFDIGMYDGADAEYYLESAYRVVAVEANPHLVQIARQKFKNEITSGRLICINAAISVDGEAVDLILSGDDLGASSVFYEWVADMRPSGSIKVSGVTFSELIDKFGVPYYLKIDIEGSDRLCVLSLRPDNRPPYLSFEIGTDAEELLQHLHNIGFTKYKIINQVSFRELSNQDNIYDRLMHRVDRLLGHAVRNRIKRAGRFFQSGHSSGPFPWLSEGRWRTIEEIRVQLQDARKSQSLRGYWYDIHAALR
jgi:FkbM family methyltransferase